MHVMISKVSLLRCMLYLSKNMPVKRFCRKNISLPTFLGPQKYPSPAFFLAQRGRPVAFPGTDFFVGGLSSLFLACFQCV